jgi:hypothetical protein
MPELRFSTTGRPARVRRIIRIRTAAPVKIGLGGISGAGYLRATPLGSTHSPLV